jgi:hypothetical protein
MLGFASCRKCGNEIQAEIGHNLSCLGCGRMFQIPNRPEYLKKRFVRRQTIIQRLGNVPFGAPVILTRNDNSPVSISVETHFTVRPINKAIVRESIPEIPVGAACPAKWPRPDLFLEESGLMIVADLPGHKEDQISVEIIDDCLIITSLLPLCGQVEELLLPLQMEGKMCMNMNNGVLIIEI